MTPLFRMFKLSVDPGKLNEFQAAGRHNILQSYEKEPGTLAMYAAVNPENPTGDLSLKSMNIKRLMKFIESLITFKHLRS